MLFDVGVLVGQEKRISGRGRGKMLENELGVTAIEDDVLDRAGALSLVDGDIELLKELVELCGGQCSSMVSQIGDSVVQRDSEALQRTAHMLKGAISNFRAKAALDVAARLEKMGREGDMVGVEEAYVDLQREMARLKPALESLVSGNRPSPQKG